MFFTNKTDWSLLAKYMAGETNAEEKAALEAWLDAKESNRKLFQQIKTNWMKMDRMNARFDVDGAWSKLQNRIVVESNETVSIRHDHEQKISRRLFTPMRIAASLLFLVLLGAALVSVNNRMQTIRVIASVAEKNKMVRLPDGSTLLLNANTKIAYSRQFGKKNRDIVLDGEAFFDVTPDKSKPFTITAGHAHVKVLGTSFNVNMRKGDNQVEVFVTTGVVELSEKGNYNNRVLVHPGNIGLVNKSVITLAKADDDNILAWKKGVFTFNDTPLSKAISLLGDYYHVHMVIKGAGMDTIKINGSYEDDTLDRILQIIGQHNPQLTIAKSDDTIYLSLD